MAVNEQLYKRVYAYSVGDYTTDTMIAETTNTLMNLTANDPEYQFNRTMDSSNVYTTFNPTNFPNLFGAGNTDYTSVYDPDISGITEVNFNAGRSSSINLRYVFYAKSSGRGEWSFGVRWTGDYEEQRIITDTLISKSDSSIQWKDPVTNKNVRSFYGSGSDISSMKCQFVTNIDRNNILLRTEVKFGYIDGNNITNINIPDDVVRKWCESDTTGFIEYDGHTCFVTGVFPYLYVKKEDSSSSSGYIFTKLSSAKQTIIGSDSSSYPWSSNSNDAFVLSILCEKYVNGHLFYYSPAFVAIGYNIFGFCVDRANYSDTGVFSSSLYGNYPSGTVYNPYSMQNGSAIVNSIEPNDDNYFNGSFLFNYPSGTRSFGENGSDPLDLWSGRQRGYLLDGQYLLSRCWYTGSASVKGFEIAGYCYSGKEVMAMLSAFLCPFVIYNSLSNETVTPANTQTDIYVGIRDDGGLVSGNYEKYEWGITELDKELRPNDFEPVDPEEEASKPEPSPPDADRTKGDSGSILPAGAYEIGGATGMCTYYVMGYAETRAFGKSLWGGVDPVQMMKNFYFFNDNNTDYQMSYSEILDYITGLKYFPFVVGQYANTVDSGERGYRLGNGSTLMSSPSWAFGNTTYLGSVLCELDGGSVYIPHEENNFMDYEPCSVASIYVPFCGTADIKLSSVTGKTLYLKYYVDLVSGCCLAIVSMRGDDGEFPIAQLNGVVGFDMLLTGNNQNQQMSSIVSSLRHTAMSVGGSIVSAGLGLAGGDFGTLAGGVLDIGESIANTAIQMPQTASLHPMTAGTNSSLSSLCGYITAFVQATRVLSQTPGNYADTVGYIINSSHKISSLHGFTQTVNPNLNNISATDQEKQMIQAILESGFYA